jgi:hypothetical protein
MMSAPVAAAVAVVDMDGDAGAWTVVASVYGRTV